MRVALVCTLLSLLAAQQAPPVPPPIQLPPVKQRPTAPPQGQGQGRGRPPQNRPSSRVRSATGDALDRYASGEYVRSIEVLITLGGFEVTHADDWILARGSEEADDRRLTASLVALEYTAARPGLSPSLISWAAATLRNTSKPQPYEVLWLRAAVALAEGRGAWSLLTEGMPDGPNAESSRTQMDPLAGRGLLAYALSRAPDEPHLQMAGIVGAEVAASQTSDLSLVPAVGKGVVTDRIDADRIDEHTRLPKETLDRLERARVALGALADNRDVGAEARLRWGYIELRKGHLDLALAQFKRIGNDPPADPFVTYLGHVFSAWALSRSGEPDQAVNRYQAALGVLPQARSAATMLVAELLRADRLTEAETTVDKYLSTSAAPDDPLKTYLLGDFRDYPEMIERLREAIR